MSVPGVWYGEPDLPADAHRERLVGVIRRCGGDVDAPGQPAVPERQLNTWYDDDGYLNLRARLPCDEGGVLLKALDIAREQLWRQAQPADLNENDSINVSAETPHELAEAPLPDPPALRAMALSALARAFVSAQAQQAVQYRLAQLSQRLDSNDAIAVLESRGWLGPSANASSASE